MTIRPHRQSSSSRTGSSPTCKFVNCGAPEVPENAEVGLQNNGTYYGSVAFYKCNDHFKLDGKTRTHAFASASRFEWQILTPIVHHASCFYRNDGGLFSFSN